MTAAWCITCLVNEHVALSTDAVKAAFAAGNIAYLKGDWTNRNPEITRILEQHGRSGVPLYLLYAGGGEPVVLPQILTAATVLERDRPHPRSQPATQSLLSDLQPRSELMMISRDARCSVPALLGARRRPRRRPRLRAGHGQPGRAGPHRRPGAGLHADRQQRQAGLARRLQGQDRGARVDQPRLPLRAQALRRQRHAGPAEEVDRQGVVWLTRHLLGAGRAGLRDAPSRPTS